MWKSGWLKELLACRGAIGRAAGRREGGSQWQGRARSSRQPSALSLSAASWYLVPGMCPKQLSERCRNGARGDIGRGCQALLGSTGCLKHDEAQNVRARLYVLHTPCLRPDTMDAQEEARNRQADGGPASNASNTRILCVERSIRKGSYAAPQFHYPTPRL